MRLRDQLGGADDFSFYVEFFKISSEINSQF